MLFRHQHGAFIFVYAVVTFSAASLYSTVIRCAHNETINAVTGVCNCLLGYSGDSCESVAHPACRTASQNSSARGWPAPIMCGLESALSCECLRQCAASPTRGHTDYRRACYEREGGDTRSVFPNEHEQGVTYWTNWDVNERQPANWTSLKYWGKQLLPLHLCPGGCSGEGICLRYDHDEPLGPRCHCFQGLTGAACSDINPAGCPLQCSHRGRCVRGVCVCRRGWFGHACTESEARVAAARKRLASQPPSPLFSVYVWDLPTEYSTSWVLDSGISLFDVFPALPVVTQPGTLSPSSVETEWALYFSLLRDTRRAIIALIAPFRAHSRQLWFRLRLGVP